MNNGTFPQNPARQSHNNAISKLVDDARGLPSSTSELGSIQLSINEIRRRANDLRKNKDYSGDHSKAHYLLAASGLPLQEMDSSLKDLKPKQVVEQFIPKSHGSELDLYLQNQKNESILSSIETLLTVASSDFNKFVNSNINIQWENYADSVKKRFGISVNRDDLEENKDVANLSNESLMWGKTEGSMLDSGNSKLDVNTNYLIREKFEHYARIIFWYNNCRITKNSCKLTEEFIELLKGRNDFRTKYILEAWEFLNEFDTTLGTAKSSRKILEKQFLNYVDELYQNRINEGFPTNINKIKSFIESKLRFTNGSWKIANLSIVNGKPIWAVIFYLLRAGLIDDALEVAISNASSFNKIENSFVKYFKAYASSPENELPPDLSSDLHTEYNQYIKTSIDGDPFRLAVYKIIGRCDLTNKTIPAVTLSVEDWLWLNLTLVKENCSNTDPIYEKYSLNDLQATVTTFGEKRFPNNYFQVLLYSGLFERALEEAYKVNELDAIHLAIGFADKHLLHIKANKHADFHGLRTTDNDQDYIDFAKLLGNYTKSFKYSDPRIASEYLFLIAICEDPEVIDLCHEALRQLILETNEFTKLLGEVNKDGTRVPGVIEARRQLIKLDDIKEYLHTISEQTARQANNNGRIYDSLLLYQLAEEYNIVIAIVNGLLSGILSNTNFKKGMLDLYSDLSKNNKDPVALAKNLVNIYLSNPEISKQVVTKNKETCVLLLKIAEIKNTYQSKQWEYTLSQIEELDMLPFTGGSSIRRKAQEFTTLSGYIMNCIPNVLLMTMTSTSELINSLRASSFSSISKKQQIAALKSVGKNCMIYAGMIQYKMPREVYSQLIELDLSLETM